MQTVANGTVFDQLTQNPEALAELIRLSQSSDISDLWCNGAKAEACAKKMDAGEVICTNEQYSARIIAWLKSPAKEG